jgi:hypothetical protein
VPERRQRPPRNRAHRPAAEPECPRGPLRQVPHSVRSRSDPAVCVISPAPCLPGVAGRPAQQKGFSETVARRQGKAFPFKRRRPPGAQISPFSVVSGEPNAATAPLPKLHAISPADCEFEVEGLYGRLRDAYKCALEALVADRKAKDVAEAERRGRSRRSRCGDCVCALTAEQQAPGRQLSIITIANSAIVAPA